ncbi:uncharacterized protein [Nicotiana tomentosiformis]|uniref:uncharacterized protein n=1 Tax=Nicotiana tomentosiformis TaxID=4098 RepID=UPI00388C7E8A
MIIKLVVGECTLNIVSAYAPHAGLYEEVKRCFWERLDEIVSQVPPAEMLFIGGDFNGHIGSTTGGYGEVHGGFSFGDRNGGVTSLLDFAKAFGEAAIEVLGVSAGVSGGHKGNWRWNEVVQGKVEEKEEAYLKLVGSIGDEDRRASMERYKVSRKEVTLSVTEAKTTSYGRMYKELGKTWGEEVIPAGKVGREEGSGFGPSEMHQGRRW